MQPVDFTTLVAVSSELRRDWLPARCEQVYQRDRTTICLALRTLHQRGWLTISWHPQAARIHIGDAPPRIPDTFTFSQQLKHQLNGLALVAIEPLAPWERVMDLQFAQRPGDPIQWHLYIEIMGKYSNVILANAGNQIVTAAHQVTEQQSSVRPILTGAFYTPPPSLTGPLPSLQEPQERWQERISLIPGLLSRQCLKAYAGLSSALINTLIQSARLAPDVLTSELQPQEWDNLFSQWHQWLQRLAQAEFAPGWTPTGYTMLATTASRGASSVNALLNEYYTGQVNQQSFRQLHHQLTQKLQARLQKLLQKSALFDQRWELSDLADDYRCKADLLMTYAYQWQPGITQLTVADFETQAPITLEIDPEKTAIQMAQLLYKRHQKLKRSRQALEPLIQEVRAEITYLEQVEAALTQLVAYSAVDDLEALTEIQQELIQQGYLEDPNYRESGADSRKPNFHRYATPKGFEVWIGRNNKQNDLLTFRTATDYDLWFHTQEIPGSHVLLRLKPGAVPSEDDIQWVADLAAYFSRARQADQVPVVYTAPKHVYKPKGARPGMVIYKHETVVWGQPQRVPSRLQQENTQEMVGVGQLTRPYRSG